MASLGTSAICWHATWGQQGCVVSGGRAPYNDENLFKILGLQFKFGILVLFESNNAHDFIIKIAEFVHLRLHGCEMRSAWPCFSGACELMSHHTVKRTDGHACAHVKPFEDSLGLRAIEINVTWLEINHSNVQVYNRFIDRWSIWPYMITRLQEISK